MLAAAGFGLLPWLGISVMLVSHGASMATLRALQLWSLILAFPLLAVAGGIGAAGGIPADWRRAPTLWHARRNALAVAAIVLACAIGALLVWVAPGSTRALPRTLGAADVVGVRPLLWLVAGATVLGALLTRRELLAQRPGQAAFAAAGT